MKFETWLKDKYLLEDGERYTGDYLAGHEGGYSPANQKPMPGYYTTLANQQMRAGKQLVPQSKTSFQSSSFGKFLLQPMLDLRKAGKSYISQLQYIFMKNPQTKQRGWVDSVAKQYQSFMQEAEEHLDRAINWIQKMQMKANAQVEWTLLEAVKMHPADFENAHDILRNYQNRIITFNQKIIKYVQNSFPDIAQQIQQIYSKVFLNVFQQLRTTFKWVQDQLGTWRQRMDPTSLKGDIGYH
jgi:hypothetical protein